MSTKTFNRFILFYFFGLVLVHAKIPIFDEQGNETGLFNMNPDPLGTPWVVGPEMVPTKEQVDFWSTLPKFMIADHLRSRQLPEELDLTENPEFPPIINQGQTNSCSQCSVTGYMLSYGRNCRNSISATKENTLAPIFTWSMVNKGANNGSWQTDGMKIGQNIAGVTVARYGSWLGQYKYTHWYDGYKGYHEANNAYFGEIQEIDVTTIEGINNLKQWFYDCGNGTPGGAAVCFSSNTSFQIEEISSGPHQGEKLCTYLPNGTAHSMVFAGYSEKISYDINGDERITNDIDITRDGIIDLADRETGALLLVNSWGTSWQNKGKIWVTYATVKQGTYRGIVWTAPVLKREPKFALKISLTHTQRSKIKITSGFSPDINASTPSQIQGYEKAFNKTGGAYPMEGNGGKNTIEFGLDVSNFADQIAANEAKFFLIVNANSIGGTVNSLALVDYTVDPPKEIMSEQSNVSIQNGNNYIGVKYIQTTPMTLDHSQPKLKQNLITKVHSSKQALYIPFNAKSQVSILNPQGRILTSFYTDNKGWYSIPSIVSGVYIVTVFSDKKMIKTKISTFKKRTGINIPVQ